MTCHYGASDYYETPPEHVWDLLCDELGLRIFDAEGAIMPAMTGLAEWWSDGEHIRLPIGGADRAIFVRRMGAGPAMTLLHGFPSSSHDWAKVAPTLAERHALLLPTSSGSAPRTSRPTTTTR